LLGRVGPGQTAPGLRDLLLRDLLAPEGEGLGGGGEPEGRLVGVDAAPGLEGGAGDGVRHPVHLVVGVRVLPLRAEDVEVVDVAAAAVEHDADEALAGEALEGAVEGAEVVGADGVVGLGRSPYVVQRVVGEEGDGVAVLVEDDEQADLRVGGPGGRDHLRPAARVGDDSAVGHPVAAVEHLARAGA
jgi:hypothetical protein